LEGAEALIAFYEKRYDEALAKAQVADMQLPWLYEARAFGGSCPVDPGPPARESLEQALAGNRFPAREFGFLPQLARM
jgi:hypothetical protein